MAATFGSSSTASQSKPGSFGRAATVAGIVRSSSRSTARAPPPRAGHRREHDAGREGHQQPHDHQGPLPAPEIQADPQPTPRSWSGPHGSTVRQAIDDQKGGVLPLRGGAALTPPAHRPPVWWDGRDDRARPARRSPAGAPPPGPRSAARWTGSRRSCSPSWNRGCGCSTSGQAREPSPRASRRPYIPRWPSGSTSTPRPPRAPT